MFSQHGTELFKVLVHLKMNILSSFTQLHVVPNPHEFLSFAEDKRWGCFPCSFPSNYNEQSIKLSRFKKHN